MTVNNLLENSNFKLITVNPNQELAIKSVFCCDLLSIAMGKAPAESAWVTVMANINTLAVATLTEVSCIVLAEGTNLDDNTLEKANSKGITVFTTDLPVFDAALIIHGAING